MLNLNRYAAALAVIVSASHASACECISEVLQSVRQIESTTDTDRSKFASQAAFCYLSENEERFKSAAKADGEADFLGIIKVGGDGSYDREEFRKAREQYCSAEASSANLDTLNTNLSSRFDQNSLRAVQSCLSSCQNGGLYCNISAEDDLVTTVVA